MIWWEAAHLTQVKNGVPQGSVIGPKQCFTTLFPKVHQQYTIWMSLLFDPSISCLIVSTNGLMSWIRCLWLIRIWKCILLVCIQEQGWETLDQWLLNELSIKHVGSYHVWIQNSGIAFWVMFETQIYFHLKCRLKTHLFNKDNFSNSFNKIWFPQWSLGSL